MTGSDAPDGSPQGADDIAHPVLDFTYRTYRLDASSPDIQFLAGKYAALSLHALTTDPGSFGMAYFTEARFTPAQWVQRISRERVHVFICVAQPADWPAEGASVAHGEWVGMVTQIGPTAKQAFWLKDSGAPEPAADGLETRWHQTGLWIDPAHRGKGVARKVIEAGVAYARESVTGTVVQARLRAFTGPANESSKKLYGGRGFPVVGKCTIREAVEGNGNAEWGFLGRMDWPERMMNDRLGVIMERVVGKEE